MTQFSSSNVDTADSPRYETPTFDPRSAFARTLRSGEIARRERRQRQNRPADPSELATNQPDAAQQVNGNEQIIPPVRRYQTPTFHPRSAFARTLRSGEIARLEREQRLAAPTQLDVLAHAA